MSFCNYSTKIRKKNHFKEITIWCFPSCYRQVNRNRRDPSNNRSKTNFSIYNFWIQDFGNQFILMEGGNFYFRFHLIRSISIVLWVHMIWKILFDGEFSLEYTTQEYLWWILNIWIRQVWKFSSYTGILKSIFSEDSNQNEKFNIHVSQFRRQHQLINNFDKLQTKKF